MAWINTELIFGLLGFAALIGLGAGFVSIITNNIGSKDTATNFRNVISQIMATTSAMAIVLLLLSLKYTYSNQVNERMYVLVMIAFIFFMTMTSLGVSALIQTN
jgi:hypothetical protein